MIPGETILSGAPQICGPNNRPGWEVVDDWMMHPVDKETGHPITVDVLWDVYQSGAGYYIGTMCPYCGPHTRESVYMDKDMAERLYKTFWLLFISDGKFDVDKYESTPGSAIPGDLLPGQRY